MGPRSSSISLHLAYVPSQHLSAPQQKMPFPHPSQLSKPQRSSGHAIAPWPPCPPGWWAPHGPVHIPQLPCLPVVTSAPHALSFQPCTSHSSPLTLLLAHPTLCVESKCLSYATSSFSRAETTFYPIVSPTKGRREGMPKSRCSKRKTRGMHATQVAAEITSDRGGKEWRGCM